MAVGRPSLRRLPSNDGVEDVPFPTRQLFILALCRICEPIAFMSIFPYIYYMVKSFNITTDERQIAMYAGMVTSAFAMAEFLASIFWGRLSDRVGRKPILLTGLAGTGISMVVFGFAPSLPIALLARALGGILNGNIGVLQTTVAEVVTVEKHQPRAFSIMPFVWCLGSIVGAGLGGTLAEPVKSYPSLFRVGGLFDRFPYLLPNLVCAGFVVFGLVVGLLFLEETHEDKKDRRDVGVECGKWILQRMHFGSTHAEKLEDSEENVSFLTADEKYAGYDSTDSSPRLSSVRTSTTEVDTDFVQKLQGPAKKALSWGETFNNQVMLNILGLGILAFHTIAFEQLLPVFFSMPESNQTPILPFKFSGGFALSTKTIGLILSCQGFLQMIAQLFLFPVINRRYGSLKTFRYVIFGYPLLYFLVPYLSLVPQTMRYPAIFFILVWKVTAQSLSYPSTAIMLVNASPDKRVLGTLNGIAASSASLARTIGPIMAGVLQAAGLRMGYAGLSWWSCGGVAVIGAIVSLWQEETKRKNEAEVRSLEVADEEEMLGEALLRHGAIELGENMTDDAASVESTLVDEEESPRTSKEL